MRNPSWSLPDNRYQSAQKDLNTNDQIEIAIGGAQSYGDANFHKTGTSVYVSEKYMNFDPATNLVEVSASVTVKELINYLLPFSRTLIVVPGTPNASIAGCVASDIHGKNSFNVGSFSGSVIAIQLMNSALTHWIDRRDESFWKSTIGGQGLSGVMIRIKLSTSAIKSSVLAAEKFITRGIENNLTKLVTLSANHEFAVGWIDSRGTGQDNFGFVEVADSVDITEKLKPIRNINLIPSLFPRMRLINRFSIRIYSWLTRLTSNKVAGKKRLISRWNYLFPNINFGKWNRLFGRKGFHEIQFMCDIDSLKFAADLLSRICHERDVFLIGTKVLSQEPEGYLSFPGKGLSIAVNFAADSESQSYVENVYDEIVETFNSRIYLTKDWVLSPRVFKLMYPKHESLRNFRKVNSLNEYLRSDFSDRVQLDF